MKLQRKMHGDFVVVDGEDVEKLEAENERLRAAVAQACSMMCEEKPGGYDGCENCWITKALNGGDE